MRMPMNVLSLSIGVASVAFYQPTAGYAQSSNTGYAGRAVTISFASSGEYAIDRGVSIGFVRSSDVAGKGVSVAFGSSVPSATQITAAYGQAGTPRNPAGTFAEPVNTATGNYFTTITDLAVPGRGLAFIFSRSYNSADSYNGPLGIGWTHSFNIVLTVNPDSSVSIKEADGGVVAFSPSTGGTYSPVTVGIFETLLKNADGSFSLTEKKQTSFNFSPAGRLISVTDRNNNTQTLTYDNLGRLTTVTDTALRAFTLTYNSSNLLAYITDPLGRTVQYEYDGLNHLTSVQDPMGSTTTYSYDPFNRLVSATDPRGNVYLQNTYDALGRVVAQQNARHFTTAFAYDTPVAGTTTVTDPLGNVTEQVNDSAWRLVQEIDATGGITSYSYTTSNLRASITDPLGNATRFSYDANGNTTSITDPVEKITAFTYDAQNDLLSSTDRLGRTAHFSYDSRGNLLSRIDPAGQATTFSHDSYGQVLTATNARGFTTSFQYDSKGDLLKTIDALGGTVNLTYDIVGRVTSIQN